MGRLRRNEWNFASNAAARITELLSTEALCNSPIGRAEAELTEFMGNRRLDLVLFDRQAADRPLITGELKVPWSPEGRTPHNSRLLEDAHRKASNCGAPYFITWNIRRAVVWRTDDPGVPLPQRIVYEKELISTPLTKAADLSRPEFQTGWRKAVEELTVYLTQLLTASTTPEYLPVDRQFVGRLESLLDFPVQLTIEALEVRLGSDRRFRRRFEGWMRDRQQWIVSAATQAENVRRASRFSCYLLVNRLCFYNALRQRWPQLPRLTVPRSTRTADALRRRLSTSFAFAMATTHDYDTVFSLDVGDELPFLADTAVPDWRSLIASLDAYDFASIPLEIIGQMYERLISPEERYRYGQHYTQPAIVDLINSFSIHDGRAQVLDPACGGGTFLVRAYARKESLDNTQDHTDLLTSLYGCDVLQYACHLTIINLALRDLIDDENYPVIHTGDFLEVSGGSTFAELPTRIMAGGLPTGTRRLPINEGSFDAVVGNPPYIQARELSSEKRTAYLTLAQQEWPSYAWDAGSDILVWFFTHGARFVRMGGHLSLITQSAWLDVEYGVPLQQWILDHFRVVAILDTEAEAWFSDARVATVVTILAREDDPQRRADTNVRFVQFRARLDRPQAADDERVRQQIADQLRDSIMSCKSDTQDVRFRLRIVRQQDLFDRGRSSDGSYVGSKWGRYLRAIDSLYDLQRDREHSFCALGNLAAIRRGVTTNCDDFFIVTDISQHALSRFTSATAFYAAFGARRPRVANGEIRIVRRRDGVELPLDASLLVPILKTARDLDIRCTSQLDNRTYAVCIPEGPRASLSHLAQAYIDAGEREHWHESPTFQGRDDWYVLRDAAVAPIHFVKTVQYSPQLIWNDAGLLANQRLYNITPIDGVNAEALGAVLSSTLFAAERFAASKALGREAANDVEVFTARMFRVPDIRMLSARDERQLRAAFRRLCQRRIGSLLEPTLEDAGLHEANVYAEAHPISEAVWPAELHDRNRQRIDEILLCALGVAPNEAAPKRIQLYNELLAFTRRARLVELEAQVNRRGQSTESASAAQLADDVWAELTESGEVAVRRLPDDFLPDNLVTVPKLIPAGQVAAPEGGLFDKEDIYVLRFGRGTDVTFDSREQQTLALLLAQNRVRGELRLPSSSAQCRAVTAAIREYLDTVVPRITAAAEEITENPDLQTKIISEALKRLVSHRR